MAHQRPLLDRYHRLRYWLGGEKTTQLDVLNEKGEEQLMPLPPGSVFIMAGSVAWRAKTLEESRARGMGYLPGARTGFSLSPDRPLFGYRVREKMNKGYTCRCENEVKKDPDGYYDEAAVDYVQRYFAPLLKTNGANRSADDIARDMRISLIVHSYNEFPIMVENVLRETLSHEGFSLTDQKKIMSQVFSLELGCNGYSHRTDPELPGFMHMQIHGINDERMNGLATAEKAVASATPLWGNPQQIDMNHSAGALLAPNRIGILVQTPITMIKNNERVDNSKGHGIEGYVEVIPPQAMAMIQGMINAEKLPDHYELSTPGVSVPVPDSDWRQRHDDRARSPATADPLPFP